MKEVLITFVIFVVSSMLFWFIVYGIFCYGSKVSTMRKIRGAREQPDIEDLIAENMGKVPRKHPDFIANHLREIEEREKRAMEEKHGK